MTDEILVGSTLHRPDSREGRLYRRAEKMLTALAETFIPLKPENPNDNVQTDIQIGYGKVWSIEITLLNGKAFSAYMLLRTNGAVSEDINIIPGGYRPLEYNNFQVGTRLREEGAAGMAEKIVKTVVKASAKT